MSDTRTRRLAVRELLLAALGRDLRPDPERLEQAAAGMDSLAWARLPAICDNQGITLPARAALSRLGDATPATVRAELDARALAHRAAALRVLIALERLTPTLDRFAPGWLVFKGPVLADAVYRTPGMRSYSDVDVLISPTAVRRTITALEDAGCVQLSANWKLIAERDSRELSFLTSAGVSIDLHWYPLGAAGNNPGLVFDTANALRRARQVTIGTATDSPLVVNTFSAADQLAHLATHAVISGMGPLRYCLDLEQALLHDAPNPADLDAALREQRVALPLAVALHRSGQVFPHLHQIPIMPRVNSRSAWLALTDMWNRLRPPQSSHEPMPLDFLLACSRESGRASFRVLLTEMTSRLSGLGRPKQAVARLREGSQRGFALDPFLEPVDEGFRDHVLNQLDKPPRHGAN